MSSIHDSEGDIHSAILMRDWDEVRILLDSNNAQRLVEHKDENGYNALHMTSLRKVPLDILKLILAVSNEAPLHRDKYGRTPLYLAVIESSDESIIKLIETCSQAAAIVANDESTPLHKAIYFNKSTTVIRYLLAAHPSALTVANINGETPLGMFFGQWNISLRNKQFKSTEDHEPFHIDDLMVPDSFGKATKIKEVYDKTVLILQAATQGTIEDDLPTIFRTLHAAINIPQCPLSLFDMILKIDHKQVHLQDEKGNLPIHVATAAESSFDGKLHKCSKCDCTFNDSFWYQHKRSCKVKYCQECFSKMNLNKNGYIFMNSVDKTPMVIKDLLEISSKVASFPNHDGRMPLCVAVESGKSFEGGGVKAIFKASPESLQSSDSETHLFPFMLSAVDCDGQTKVLEKFSRCFSLLIENPVLLSSGIA